MCAQYSEGISFMVQFCSGTPERLPCFNPCAVAPSTQEEVRDAVKSIEAWQKAQEDGRTGKGFQVRRYGEAYVLGRVSQVRWCTSECIFPLHQTMP